MNDYFRLGRQRTHNLLWNGNLIIILLIIYSEDIVTQVCKAVFNSKIVTVLFLTKEGYKVENAFPTVEWTEKGKSAREDGSHFVLRDTQSLTFRAADRDFGTEPSREERRLTGEDSETWPGNVSLRWKAASESHLRYPYGRETAGPDAAARASESTSGNSGRETSRYPALRTQGDWAQRGSGTSPGPPSEDWVGRDLNSGPRARDAFMPAASCKPPAPPAVRSFFYR